MRFYVESRRLLDSAQYMTIGDTMSPSGRCGCLSAGQSGDRARLPLPGAMRMPSSRLDSRMLAQQLPLLAVMLKLLGSIAIGRLLGFGIVGILVIYALLTLLR